MKKIKYISSRYGHNVGNHFRDVTKMIHQCIPYEGNEHLLGTTNKTAK